ncbi:phosphoribosylanthranilate isomerase [Paenibacillus pini]|uniref:N-(5'-phosphoribosyl)anthranilate isomerase n=1 Tax=Paenibacillus pini JCM 16418 TaxID=1236976 RepID=W7Z418_9BACL|nr:phosphoribosylanthranilate isomerase [Paenibacillus pini]GAF09069.1 phosphoribosylanthranilate isomerase [Paenibacillus pini JCM 16418]
MHDIKRGTKVKICGLQDVEVLKSMIHLPVNDIGFVFANSRRQISPVKASELLGQLQEWDGIEKPRSVGVFVNPDLEQLETVMSVAQLDVIQLHGQESPAFCKAVKERFQTSIYKVMSVRTDCAQDEQSMNLEDYADVIDSLLLDTHDPQYGGGSGTTFAWDRIPFYREWTARHGIELIVAGGLHADNVEQLIKDYKPDGVDISSGVETDGVKDIDKIVAFVERVKQA